VSNSRRVIGVEHIEQARSRMQTRIELLPEDIVTDLARESAARLNIELLKGPLRKPVAAKTDAVTRTQRELFRRSPKWRTPDGAPKAPAQRLGKLVLIGAGGVGANIAHLAANANVAEQLVLIDIMPGLAASTALDLQHASGITGSQSKLSGGDDLSAVADADLVVVTAGKARTPGMSRADLTAINRRVIQSSAEAIKSQAPNAVVIVVTNPLDEMTAEMLRATEFPRERVLGMAGTLDSSRFRIAIATAAGCNPFDVEALTLGSHGDEMVPVSSMLRIRGRSVDAYLDDEQVEACVNETIHGGGAVVALRKTGSATIAPAHAVMEVIEHMQGIRGGWVPVSVLLQGEYGIDKVVAGVPVQLDARGVAAVVELPITEAEQQALHNAAMAIKQRLEQSSG